MKIKNIKIELEHFDDKAHIPYEQGIFNLRFDYFTDYNNKWDYYSSTSSTVDGMCNGMKKFINIVFENENKHSHDDN